MIIFILGCVIGPPLYIYQPEIISKYVNRQYFLFRVNEIYSLDRIEMFV
jgi:hypothetical protein